MATMTIEPYLTSDCVIALSDAPSAKAVLSTLAHLLSEHCPVLSEDQVFKGLLARERLGSTALAHGVALPHTKASGLSEPVAALITTQAPVDFAALDNKKVDIIVGLLMPSDPQQHLDVLKEFASKLSQEEYRHSLRAATTSEMLFSVAIK